MWRKVLLVGVVLLAGCSMGEEQVSIETQLDLDSEESAGSKITQEYKPTLQPVVETQASISLPNLGPAPEWTNEVWLNTDQPLRLVDLKGKVVLLEMWTFG